MGRGGGGRGRGGGDKTAAFFAAIETQKVETVRWSIVYGGITLTTCDDNGDTGLMVAARLGRQKSMEIMLEQVARMRSAADRSDCLNARDGEGSTPLMMAAAGGRVECVKMLMGLGAKLDLKDEEGYTARARAEWAGQKACVDKLDGIVSESSEEEADSDGAVEGETAAERRKRKKQQFGGVGLSCSSQRNAKKKDDAEGEDKKKEAPVETSKPVLKEIADGLAAAAEEEKISGSIKELKMSLVRTDENQAAGLAKGAMDPALWRCGPTIRHLEIRWRPGLAAGSLDRIGALKRILHLVVQDSGLPALPESLCELQELRSMEVDGNALATFPSSMKKLASTLESISAARNNLTSECLERLAPLDHLVSLKLDQNKLEDLEELVLNSKPHLVTLSVCNNKLTDLPEDPWGNLTMLQHLNVSANKLTELPCEMGAMKEKKLTELLLHDNPWKDGKIRNFVDQSSGTGTVLTYLRKQKPKGKKQAKAKAKRKAKAESESDVEAEEVPAVCEKPDDDEEEEPAPEEKKEKKKKKKKDKKEKKEKDNESEDGEDEE